MRFELSVCLRYLAPKRGRLFISASTLFSILGLALGVTTYITVVSVMTGFRNQITAAYSGYFSDLIAYKEREVKGRRRYTVVSERDMAVIEKAAGQVPGIIAVSPFVYGKVNLRIDNLVYPFDMRGVDPEREPKVSAILAGNKLVEGDFKFERDGDYVAIVIGKKIADDVGLNLNDELIIGSTSPGSVGVQHSNIHAYVAGIFSYGNIEQDLSVYVHIETAQVLQGLGLDVHRVSIKLDDPDRVFEIKQRLAAKIEELRKRDRLADHRGTIGGALTLLDRAVPALKETPAKLRRLASAADLDEENARRVEALAALVETLPQKLTGARASIAGTLGYGSDYGLDEKAPLKAAVAAVDAIQNDLDSALTLTRDLEAAVAEGVPLPPELAAAEYALADASEAARSARSTCDAMIFEPFVVLTSAELNPMLFSAVNQERVITALFVALIVVVAGFIIISGLSMTVVQKKREIGIMRAMGARAASVATIFGMSGFVIGLIGTVLGTLGGLLISYNFNTIRDWMSDVLSIPRLFGYYPMIPISVQLADLIVIWSFTMVWSVLASIVPALSAARLHPAEALRWE